MSKYYISCGSFSYIMSTNKTAEEAAAIAISDWFNCYMNEGIEEENAFLDETVQVDERGLRYANLNADEKTVLFNTSQILQKLGLE